MKTRAVIIDFDKISDWRSFHSVFSEAMGFPKYYGKNMNAWIDCMSYINEPEAGMSTITVDSDESLEITVLDTKNAFETCPEIISAFIECTSSVNQRFIETESNTRLKIVAT